MDSLYALDPKEQLMCLLDGEVETPDEISNFFSTISQDTKLQEDMIQMIKINKSLKKSVDVPPLFLQSNILLKTGIESANLVSSAMLGMKTIFESKVFLTLTSALVSAFITYIFMFNNTEIQTNNLANNNNLPNSTSSNYSNINSNSNIPNSNNSIAFVSSTEDNKAKENSSISNVKNSKTNSSDNFAQMTNSNNINSNNSRINQNETNNNSKINNQDEVDSQIADSKEFDLKLNYVSSNNLDRFKISNDKSLATFILNQPLKINSDNSSLNIDENEIIPEKSRRINYAEDKNNLALTLRGFSSSSSLDFTLESESNPIINNIAIGLIFYEVNDNLSIGAELGQENFLHEFKAKNGNNETIIQQNNLALWWGANATYQFNSLTTFKNIKPYTNILVGYTNIGPIGRMGLGLAYEVSDKVLITAGGELTSLVSKYNGDWYNSYKYGFTYGVKMRF